MTASFFNATFFDQAVLGITPILLAAMAGTLSERVGLFNIALEGEMLVGAFAAVAGSHFGGSLQAAVLAAVAAGARVERALEILGDEAPDHLTMAGKLRIANRQASLEELGQLADPPLTKDAIAGRIRRLLAMADRRAIDQGVPGTEANLTADMLMP